MSSYDPEHDELRASVRSSFAEHVPVVHIALEALQLGVATSGVHANPTSGGN